MKRLGSAERRKGRRGVGQKALNMQEWSAAQLIQALPQPAQAASAWLVTQVNTFV
jgi:hypothetical protein